MVLEEMQLENVVYQIAVIYKLIAKIKCVTAVSLATDARLEMFITSCVLFYKQIVYLHYDLSKRNITRLHPVEDM